MSGSNLTFRQDATSSPFKNTFSQVNSVSISNKVTSRQPNNQRNQKDMSFSRNPDDGSDVQNIFQEEFFKRQRYDNKNLEGSQYETPHYLANQNRNNMSLNDFPGQMRQKNEFFQRNDTDNFQSGSNLSYNITNDNSVQNRSSPSRKNNSSPKSKSFQNNQRKTSKDEKALSPRNIPPQHYTELRRSLEYLTPNIIDQGLKQLRQMNEVKQVGSLASPSVIFNHCVDEEEIVQNIRGLARELRNIGIMKSELDNDLKQKFDNNNSTTKKKIYCHVFDKLYQEADEKEKKLQYLQSQKEKEIEIKQNMSAVNIKSQLILQEKKNYIKIQERVDNILQKKQIKMEQLSFQKKMEENQQINKFTFRKSAAKNYQYQNSNLDYSLSTENNVSNLNNDNNMSSNLHRFSEKGNTISQFAFKENHPQPNKGYTKKQLDEFIGRHERKQQSIHEQIIEKKLQKEQNEMSNVTFHPKINKKSEQLTQSTWEPIEERIEKMQEKMIVKRKQIYEEEYSKFRFSPLINKNSSVIANRTNRSPLNKSFNNLSRSNSPISKSQTQRLCNSQLKTKEDNLNVSRPISAQNKSLNSSFTQLNQNKFIKNDSSYNISSYDNKNNSNQKNGLSQSQRKLSCMSVNENVSISQKDDKLNASELAKEDYLTKYSQQYMIKQDQILQQKQNKSSSRLTSNRSSQQHEIQALQEQLKQSQNLSQSQYSQRSRSSLTLNKQHDKKSSIQLNKNTITNSQTKELALNSENKFLLSLVNQKKK